MQGYDLISYAGLARKSRKVPLLPRKLNHGCLIVRGFQERFGPGAARSSHPCVSSLGALSGFDQALGAASARRSAMSPFRNLRPDQKSDGARPIGGGVKRDCRCGSYAACALVVLAPMLLFLAVLIRTVTGSSPVFAHERVGFRRTFVPLL